MSAIRYLLIFTIVFLPASPFATTFPVTKATDTDDGICDPTGVGRYRCWQR